MATRTAPSGVIARSPVFVGTQIPKGGAGAARVARTVAKAADRPNWLPGSERPAWLDGSLPGDFGYDPLQLAKEPQNLKWYVQAELMNGRWAMLGVVGMLVPELFTNAGIPFLGKGTQWFNAGAADVYWTSTGTLYAIELLLMGWAEARRYQDFVKEGSVNEDPIFGASLPDDNKVGYPGGIFDPLGFCKGDVESLKLKEIKNGRLAMLATLGFFCQYIVTGKGPVECWQNHIDDPWGNNVWTIELAKVFH